MFIIVHEKLIPRLLLQNDKIICAELHWTPLHFVVF